ncbi:hypothetical protein [Paenibacillus sp. MBLB4367]|uniref:hypothetical protein n=1 Tax=Paenibacillus sp. MBLB4367 TaxID=3384767 RepID=UPI00390816EE
MKTVKIPSFFHEVFGEKQTAAELFFIIVFGVGMSGLMLACTYPEWGGLAWWKIGCLALLALDINGGVVANVTLSTNNYYKASSRARLLFIAIHVQPVLLSLIFGESLLLCLLVWGYTIGSALVVNALIRYPAQRTVAAVLAAAGFGGLLMLPGDMPKILIVTLLFYMFKVIYSFAVDHYAQRGE